MKIVILKWFIGWCVSFGIIWLITAFCTNPIGQGSWSRKYQRYTYPEGTDVFWAEEGWGHTRYGKYGINANEDSLTNINPKVILWGDSHIQNRHVDDSLKVQTVFNSISLSEKSEYRAVNMGMFGQNIAHYCVQIPIYEKLIPNIRHHFIIVSGMKDLLPSKLSNIAQKEPAIIWTDNKLSLVASNAENEKPGKIRIILSTYRLQILKHIKNIILGSEKLNTGPIWSRFNFLGKTPGSAEYFKDDSLNKKSSTKINKVNYWDFLLKELKSTSKLPITIIYSPTFSRFEKNRVVFTSSEEKDLEAFRKKCQQMGVSFLDLNKECIDLYLNNKQFHRGFFNTVPSTGHVNANFNIILARKLHNFLSVKDSNGLSPN